MAHWELLKGMSQPSNDSEFSARVHRDHFDNFTRRLRDAENSEDVQKVLKSIEIAVTRMMIDQSELKQLIEYSKTQTRDLKK